MWIKLCWHCNVNTLTRGVGQQYARTDLARRRLYSAYLLAMRRHYVGYFLSQLTRPPSGSDVTTVVDAAGLFTSFFVYIMSHYALYVLRTSSKLNIFQTRMP